jgi:hypothetical protein
LTVAPLLTFLDPKTSPYICPRWNIAKECTCNNDTERTNEGRGKAKGAMLKGWNGDETTDWEEDSENDCKDGSCEKCGCEDDDAE